MQKSVLSRIQKRRDDNTDIKDPTGWYIGTPYNVKHHYHVKIDPTSPTGFSGLPPDWESMLKSSGISKDDINAFPEEVRVVAILCSL